MGADVGAVDAVGRFAQLVARPEPDVDLGVAALALAAGAYPDLDLAARAAELERVAEGVKDLDGLLGRLFGELGLRGDTERYHDPDNSFLHRVLDRRLGIPISLSVLVIEVGRRAGVTVRGVGMPGHFLIWAQDEQVYLDPFAGGAVLDEAGVEARFRGSTGSDIAFGPALLPRVGAHGILTRMLANLRAIYRASASAPDLEWVLGMRLALPEATSIEVAELGEALAAQGRYVEGAAVLEARAAVDPRDADQLEGAARLLRSRLN